MEIVHNRTDVIAQLNGAGLALSGDEELREFEITYRIARGTSYLTGIENRIEQHHLTLRCTEPLAIEAPVVL